MNDKVKFPFEQWLRVAETRELEDELTKLNRERERLEKINPHLRGWGREHLRQVGELRATALDWKYHGLVWQGEAIEAELARRRALGKPLRLDRRDRTLVLSGKKHELRTHPKAFATIELLLGADDHEMSQEEINCGEMAVIL